MEKQKIIIWTLLAIPLMIAGYWLVTMAIAYFAPVPVGVQQAPIPKNKIFAAGAFTVGYSIFLALFAIKGNKD